MRWFAVGLVPLLLPGCGAKLSATGPVMSGYERAAQFPVARPFNNGALTYGAAPATTAPVIPFMAFGAAFDLDVVLMPSDSEFDMIEFVRFAGPEGPIWLALESATATGEQTMVSSHDALLTMLPEMPLARKSVDTFSVTDRSDAERVDLMLSYDNSAGQRVDAEIAGGAPVQFERNRNGRMFDRAQSQALVALDIAAAESLYKAVLTIGGEPIKFRKVGGIVPGKYVVDQTMGGLAVASYTLTPTEAAAGGDDYGHKLDDGIPDVAPAAEMTPDMHVRMAVAKNFPSIAACHDAAAAGTLTLGWTVTEGVVSDVATVASEAEDALADEAVASCVIAAISAWTLDPSVTGTVSWPFTFQDAETEAERVTVGEGAVMLADAEDEDEVEDDEDEEGEDEDAEDAEDAEAPPAPTHALSNFTTVHSGGDEDVALRWAVTHAGDRVIATQTSPLRTLTYNYRLLSEAYLELVSITVTQYGRATPVTAITFNPPIPDVRWPFNGRRTSDMIVDINGQQNHLHAKVESFWTETGPRLKVTPIAPARASGRVMQTSITYNDGAARINIERIGE